ncbi:MAG: LysR family transcriptional regulator [Planctomycetes bacterium]|nr:LysR family transcriptional regulator [Planctomycetota bacterium]
MPRRSVPRRLEHEALAPRVKVWLEAGGHYAFGFGLSEILRAVGQAGSIKQAAVDLGKSYRHVWGRIKQAERVLGRSLVQTHVGGKDVRRSSLTPAARQLVEHFLSFRTRMMQAAEEEFARAFAPHPSGTSMG